MDDLDYDLRESERKLKTYLKPGINLFSLESLTGAPFTFKGLNRSVIVKRLKDLELDKVIVTIRSQTEILDSLYRQYIYQGGVMRFKDFLNLNEKWNPYLRAFNLGYLKYDGLIEKYQHHFGSENVLVLPQELLKVDKRQYLKKIEDFTGEKMNPGVSKKKLANESLSNLSTGFLRVINHFTFNSQRPNQLLSNHISTKTIKKGFQVILDPYFVSFVSKKRNYLRGEEKERIRLYYRESNQKLNAMIEMDLGELGYSI